MMKITCIALVIAYFTEPNHTILQFFNLDAAISQYFFDKSIQIYFLHKFCDANVVVQIQLKGSNTISSVYEYNLSKRSTSSTGYGAGCSHFFAVFGIHITQS